MRQYNGGWFAMHRKLFTGTFKRDGVTQWLILYLVGQACWQEQKIPVGNGEILTLNRGEIWTTERELSEASRFPRSTIKRKLAVLCNNGTISTKRGPKGTIITLLNYSSFQDIVENPDQDWTTSEPNLDQARTYINKETRKQSNKEQPSNLVFPNEDSNYNQTNSSFPPPSKKSGGRKPPVTAAVWAAYSKAYFHRYGTEPTRNATVNGQLANLVKRLGEKEAPLVAEFYLSHTDFRYIKALHSVGLLLQDCEKLRTEWITGRKVTTAVARQIEKAQDFQDQQQWIDDFFLTNQEVSP